MEGRNSIAIYQVKGRKNWLEVKLENETVWLTQKQMSELFRKSVPTINEHIRNIFHEKELKRDATIRDFQIVQSEGGRTIERNIECYNLDVIISVGYRVKSKEGTKFRIWATNVLKSHLVNGFSVNNDRLKELQSDFESQKETYMQLRFFLNKFLGTVARKDVIDTLIGRVEEITEDIKEIRKLIAKIKK